MVKNGEFGRYVIIEWPLRAITLIVFCKFSHCSLYELITAKIEAYDLGLGCLTLTKLSSE